MKLRDYQQHGVTEIHAAWQSVNNVMFVLPTGGGKTVVMSNIINNESTPVCAIAHRQELVSQISLALGRCGVHHKMIAPGNVIKGILQQHHAELGRSYYDPSSQVAVAGVDTLVKRGDEMGSWADRVGLWVMDEGHHVLANNKWGKAASMFPNARGLGVTATPCRADGRGLGSHADGLTDIMVEGPNMRELINRGYLTDYRIFAPPSNLDLSDVNVTSSGDYSKTKLKTAVNRSNIMGDVVEHYLRIAPGKLGITFATDVETASNIASRFNSNGVVAEVVSAKTPSQLRSNILRRFKNREVMQLVNVDLFGEGFDLPALEVVSMARPTQSYALFSQQFGRALRIMENKDEAIIIDHVGNVVRHGLPDAPRTWSLDRREARGRGKQSDDVIPVRVCPVCTGVFERIYTTCPFCSHVIQPENRSKPEFVDGDLHELDPAALAAMRGEIDRIDVPFDAIRQRMEFAGAPHVAIGGAVKNHLLRQEGQAALRMSIRWWAGIQHELGRTTSESYRRFYFKFGTDVMTAQTLGRREALELADRINLELGRLVG
jgi:superfamily II DNA or RNA helicase